MRGINMKMTLLPILLISVLATMMAVKPVSSYGETVLSINPVASGGSEGEVITVDVMITDVVDLYGYEFMVTVQDPGVAMVVDIQVGDFLPTPPGYKVWKMDIGDGSYAWLAVTRPLASASGVTGSGKLASIQLLFMGSGYTYLMFSMSILADPFGTPIEHTANAGFATTTVPAIMSADIVKRRSYNRPGYYGFEFPTMGTTQTLMGELTNLGTVAFYVRVRFEVYDEAGLPPPGGSIYYSDAYYLGVGETAVLTATMPIDSSMLSHRYYVTNYAEYLYVGLDGPTSISYSFKVVKP